MGTAIILIKLIAAHLVGDFILQTDKLCADKFSNNKAFRYSALSVHALVHAALAYLFVAQWNNWAVPMSRQNSYQTHDIASALCLSERNEYCFETKS